MVGIIKQTLFSSMCWSGLNTAIPKMFLDISHKYPRNITSLVHRFRLNALRTKYCKNIICACGNELSVKHLLKECPNVKRLSYEHSAELGLLRKSPFEAILNDYKLLSNISQYLNSSPVGIFL